MLIASGLMLSLTQGHRLGFIRHEFARKAIHIFMGTVYMACWPLFPEHPYSRVACAVVPLLSTAVVGAVGAGVVHEPALIAAASVCHWCAPSIVCLPVNLVNRLCSFAQQ